MYSDKIKQKLEEENIEIGDRIKVNKKEGELMPKPENSTKNTIILKLDSGYNLGLKPNNIQLIEKKETEEEQKTQIQYEEEKQDILVLHTGGTIASRVSYEEGGVKPAFDPEDLLEMYPEIAEEANMHSEVIAQMLSEDMEPEHWQKIAEKIHEVKDEYDGIIVGHGTDTMQYTGAALTLMLQNIDTGVLLVGAQRSSDRPSTDATINLYSATKYLTETDYKGIGICMHKTTNDKKCIIIPGAKARKMHTSRRDAFKPINTKPIAEIDYQTEEIHQKQTTNNKKDYRKSTKLNQNVGVLKTRPGMTEEEIKSIKERNYDALVIEGTGLGHMPVNSFDEHTQHHKEILETIEEIAKDTLVIMTSQCINGRTNMNVYDAGLKIQEAGVIEAKDMHPELTYVKAMWVLANTDTLEEAEENFQQNINGETTPRTLYDQQ